MAWLLLPGMTVRSGKHLLRGCAGAAALAAAAACLPFAGPSSRSRREPDPARLAELVEADPDVERRDLFYGVGGRENAPPTDEAFRFLEQDESGASTNLEVRDRRGRTWDAKLGQEARSEVAASRLLWAAGFHQPAVYFVREWRLADGPEPGPMPPARFRLERSGWSKQGEWAWPDNPFVGSRELGGLVVLMALINNWDLKTSNNAVYRSAEAFPPRVYLVKDLGQAFGHSRRIFFGSNNDVEEFTGQRLIRDVEGDRVELDFDAHLLAGIDRHVRVEDVLWLCRRLARLRDEQWRDAFRAAGYPREDAAAYVAQLRRKVREGLALAERSGS